MIILGIDPSLSSTGICLIAEDGEVIESMAVQPDCKGSERLAVFRRELRIIVAKYCTCGIRSFIEGYAFGANNQREALGELGGVLRLELYDSNIPIVVVQPTALKKFATGKGNSDKIAMGVALMKEFGLEYPTSDQTDAHWLAVFGKAYHGLIPDLSKARRAIIKEFKEPKAKKRSRKNE